MNAYAASEMREGVEAAEDRYENYAMLSRLFRVEIDKPLLQALIASPAPDATGNADFDEGYALVRRFLDGIEDIDRGKSILAIDYCLAFVGYGADPARADDSDMRAAYPYESVYRSSSKTLAGDSSSAVAAEYRQAGFAPKRDRIFADDHIACELEYLQFLAGEERSALESGKWLEAEAIREKERAFIEEHPRAWIGQLRGAVERFAETDFYRGLARMAEGWLELDARMLRGEKREAGECDA